MQITTTTSVMKVRDHDAAVQWYTALFGREPDRTPMPAAAEWNLGNDAAIQVYDDAEHAGGTDVVIGVDDVDAALADLASRGITGEAFTVPSGQFRLANLTDPSGNTVVLAADLAADVTPVGRRERLVVRRTIDSTPEQVFAILTDPTHHQDTEPTDWVRDSVDTEPITGVGHVFAMNMFLDAVGGHYVMHNLVTTFLPNRAIAWMPGARSDTGEIGYGGWFWRYDLTPCTPGTVVTLTYDWTDTPEETRAEIGGMPSVDASFLQQSLASLESATLG